LLPSTPDGVDELGDWIGGAEPGAGGGGGGPRRLTQYHSMEQGH